MKIEGKLPSEPYWKLQVGSHPKMPPFLNFQGKPIARITDAVVLEDGSISWTAEVDDPEVWRKLFAPAFLPSGVLVLPEEGTAAPGCCNMPPEAWWRALARWLFWTGGGVMWGWIIWGRSW